MATENDFKIEDLQKITKNKIKANFMYKGFVVHHISYKRIKILLTQ
jgi:hypothetical protein